MEFPTLKLPSKDYSMLHSFSDRWEAGSFSGRLSTVIREYQKTHSITYDYKESDGISQRKEKMCSAVNSYYDDLRGRVDEEMQAYILEHDGRIDSWGDSAGETVSSDEGCSFVFDYFGADYRITRSGEAVRKSPKPVYRNQYRFPGTDAYNSAEDERRSLEFGVKKAKEAGDGRFVAFLCLVGMLYLLLGMLLVLGDILFQLGSAIIDPIYEINTALGMLVSLPYTLYALIAGIFGEAGEMRIFLVVILLGACLIGFFWLLSGFKTCSEYAKALKKAKKALNCLIKSAEYKRIVAENDRLRRLNTELAEQWHRAWYDWVCTVKRSPADAAGLDPSTRAVLNELGEQVGSLDFNELLREKSGEAGK